MLPEDGKQFFVNRVIDQAKAQGVSLSKNEAEMLQWTEQYPVPGWTPESMTQLAESFAQECDDSAYEEKISDLIKRAYEDDVRRDGQAARLRYREAYEALSTQDHYILVMIDNALPSEVRRAVLRKFLGIF